jgi:hypothetical protein
LFIKGAGMLNKIREGVYQFLIKGKVFEVFFAEDDAQVEIYEVENPKETGFIFPDKKSLYLFINNTTDIVELELKKED